jgi:hypothetical protein
MKRIYVFLLVFVLTSNAHAAEVLDLNTALQNTYRACADIDNNLHDLKVLAGVNTAVTAVGTGLGVGAAATGFVKASKDKQVEVKLDKLREIEQKNPGANSSDTEWQSFSESLQSELTTAKQEIERYQAEIAKLNKESKNLGNWRTGLLAGNTVTNVAGAINSSKTINKDDIQGQIDACISATKDLSNAIMQAKMNGENIEEAQSIYKACREYEYVDISPINKRATGAMVASSIGAGLGGIGTITSGVANSEKIRNNDTDSGKKKRKDLNTASNVLAVGATAASATATVFNATQIAAIKKVAKVSESCTGVLK